jgi:putative ABC transport system substrate-binding protein
MGLLADGEGRGAAVSRRAVVGLAFVLVLGPIALRADAQPRGSIPRVALLCAVWCEALQTGRHEEGQAFVHALRELGQIDGQTVIVDERGAGIKSGLANVTADLVRRKVNIIVADGLPAAQAATKATTAIPIVMVGVADPVRLGLVPSLARPGGNVTGVAVPFEDLVKKQMELLQEAVPRTRSVGVLWNPDNPQHAPTLAAVEGAGRAVGVTVRLLQGRSRTQAELEGVVSALDREGSRALLVLRDPQAYEALNLLALRYRVATISTERDFARGGGLLAYGPDRLETVRRAAYFVDRILRGTKPGDLPVEEPTRYELIVNLATARALGLTLPQSILGRADELVR